MAKAFDLRFTTDELKMLLVAVRHMRRTFEQARKGGAGPDPSLEAYYRLYDDLFEKLLDMTGPIPDSVEDVL